jgi:LysR family glycine cleavage system transcriptional activator
LRRLPPLNALKAFEAAARHESFTRAAEELFVTQGAVSHQVKALEEELGVKLQSRAPAPVITGPNVNASPRWDAFDRIALGTERLLSASLRRPHLSTSPDFAANGWSTVSAAAEDHPTIDLRVSATLHHVDFAAKMWTSPCAMATAIGRAMWPASALSSSSQYAVPSCLPGAIGSQAGRCAQVSPDPCR